ncbi:hypothetical protein BYT27DRAFT_7225176 [Phlegmacium glaucopus]|nr:hypothetical protein BYT27DRAFT_7225176 [Phlegmacium glaucopus]
MWTWAITQKDYLGQYIDRMDEFLEAFLSREAMPDGTGMCRHCQKNVLAVWRCKDCMLGTPMCRACLRAGHRKNLFHRIEKWNGGYFRLAEQWEVGTYLLVRHHLGEAMCETLTRWCRFLEDMEEMKDNAEQDQLHRAISDPLGPAPAPFFDEDDEFDMEEGTNRGEEDDDDDECDDREDLEDPTIPHPYLGANAGAGPDSTMPGTYVRIVHSNGLHHIAMVSCHCQGDDVLPLDLFAAQLLPASFKHIKTVFTAEVLDLYRLCNLELKASAYQFYQLMRQLTRPMAPAEVTNLYREFHRMSRVWRWMKKLKWARYARTDSKVNEVGARDLAIYCPACPQAGINIPHNWKDDPAWQVKSFPVLLPALTNDCRWVFKRIFVADGNFKADHVRQRNPAGDMWLSEGSGMMPRNDEYMDFLASAIERLTVAPCENTFRAIMNALQASKLCDVTGLVSIACGRHGCYAPQALQKNIDFALLNALKSTHVQPEQGVVLIYDIACQYFVHLQDQIGSRLPFGLDIDAAIGLFHIHAHKDQCFFQYATSFIPGAAVVTGEILESLWSSLNAISPTARTATLAHRFEMLDNHATDSNHKKTLGIISSLCRSNRTAVDMLDHARTYYQNLTDQAGITAVGKWTQDVEQAEVMRKYDVSVMDMYATQMDDVLGDVPQLAPGMPGSPLASWMEMSLAAEEKQLEIQAKVRQLSRKARSIDWQTVESECEQLAALLSELKNAMHLAGVSESNQPALAVNKSLEIWDEIVNEPVPTGPNTVSAPADPPAPSNTIPSFIGPPAIEDQWIPLPSNGKKSFQFSHVIHVSPRKGVNTHSRAAVKKLNLKISVHCWLYTQCWACLNLTPGDVKASTAIVNLNEPGSTRLTLSWLWQTAGGHRWGLATGHVAGADAMPDTNIVEFRRVHWLRARAQLMRWEEEVTLTGYEMQWTVCYFLFKSLAWAVPPGTGTPGPQHQSAGSVAYARRQQAVWEDIMRKADRTFARFNLAYQSPL